MAMRAKRNYTPADRSIRQSGRRTRAVELQGLRRPADGVHEKLRRADLQIRIYDVHEILQKVRAALTTVCRPKLRCCSSAPTGAIGLIAYPLLQPNWVMVH
jgi:hypothetical protein